MRKTIGKKVLVILAVITVACLLLASCGKKEEYGERTVVDELGNEVYLAKRPERIVSLTLTTDEILLELVDKDRIRALSSLAGDEGLSNIADRIDGIELIPTVAEKVIAAQPDLVFAAPFNDADFISQLKDAGIPVYIVAVASSIDEIKESINNLGVVLGAEGEAEKLIGRMDEKLDAIKEKVNGLDESERVRALNIDAFYCTHGIGTTFDVIAQHAGVINLAAEAGLEMWAQISKEQVVEMNPDVITLPHWSFEGFDADVFAEEFKNDRALETVEAIKNGRVYMLPDKHISSINHNIVLGVEDLAKAAYPELFGEE